MGIYAAKLSKPQWQKKRLECFEKGGWKCSRCGNEKRTLHLHHPEYDGTFEKQPWEYDNLEVLCAKCHGAEHAVVLEKLTPDDCYMVIEGEWKGLVGMAVQEDYQEFCHELHFWDTKKKEWNLISFWGSFHKLRKARSREEAKFRKFQWDWLNFV